MLGCFVEPAGVAARGVPERFTGTKGSEAAAKANEAEKHTGSSSASASGNVPPTPIPAVGPPIPARTGSEGTGEAMEVD